MPGFLFLLVVDWDMRKTIKHGNTGIFLQDLDFADNRALISSSGRHIQTKFSNLGRYVNQHSKDHDNELEQVHRQKGAGQWRRAGSSVKICLSRRKSDPGGGSDEDIKSRLGKARAALAFSKLRNVWKSSQLKLKTKLKINVQRREVQSLHYCYNCSVTWM